MSEEAKNSQMSPEQLSPVQLNAIDLLSSGAGVVKTAERLGINRNTVSRWMKRNPYFIAVLNEKRKLIWADSHDRLRGMVVTAINIMETALNNGDSKVAVEVLKTVGIYGTVNAPRGSTNPDEIISQMAERYARDLLTAPSSDVVAGLKYKSNMLPVLTTEYYRDIKDNLNQYIGDDPDEDSETVE